MEENERDLFKEGLLLVKQRRERRDKKAATLREMRRTLFAECKAAGGNEAYLMKWLSVMYEHHIERGRKEMPPNPTYRNLMQEMTRLMEFSCSTWTNPYDSEYYSADGYDDAQAAEREEAEKDARVLFEILSSRYGKEFIENTAPKEEES